MKKTTLQIFYHFYNSEYLCPINIFHAKIQLKISSDSGEEIDFVIVAMF